MNGQISPMTLAEPPSTETVEMPEFDWNSQSRGNDLSYRAWTAGSIRTFDNRGNPRDSKSDQND